jgi:type 1 glutamine amidotransferase
MKNRPSLKMIARGALAALLIGSSSVPAMAAAAPRFKMFVLAELLADGKGPEDDQHKPYVDAAKIWLNQLAKDSNFTVTYFDKPDTWTDALLSDVDLIWQMNYAPYGWPAGPKAAFEKYMNSGKGSWLGIHHATLYGSVVTNQTWPLFAKLIGGISFKGYVRYFASGDVRVEEASHPIFQGVPSTFNVATEEWYTYDKNPRPKVHVLGNVDESTYKFVNAGSDGGVKMGDHPVIWTSDSVKTRNLYVFMGHHPNLYQNAAYMTLIRNSIFWLANKPSTAVAPGNQPEASVAPSADRIRVASDKRFITISAPAGLRVIDVLDASGRSLYHAAGKSLNGRIDRSQWGSGRYLVRIATVGKAGIPGKADKAGRAGGEESFSQWLELR